MARIRSAGRELAFPERDFAAIRRDGNARLVSAERLLRRSIPVLIGAFVMLTAAGVAAHFVHGKQTAIEDARARLAMLADAVAAGLRDTAGEDSALWQGALAAALPAPGLGTRRAFLADAFGEVKAALPAQGAPLGRPLRPLLGAGDLLATFGARAGVLDVRLDDGMAALATVRNLSQPDAQLAVVVPLAEALAPWRRDVAFHTTILSATTLLLILIAGAFWFLSGRAAAAARDEGRGVEGLLSAAGYGIWDWNIARGSVLWTAPVHGLLGRETRSGPLPFSEVAPLLHPDDDLYGAVERAVREDAAEFERTVRIRHADGRWLPLRLRGALRRTASGEPHLFAVASFADAAPGRRSEAAASALLRDAIESISEAFVLWDADNRLVMCNSKYRWFHKLPDDAAVPGTPYEALAAASAPPVVHRKEAVADPTGTGAQTYEAQFEDGRWLRVNERRTKDGGFVSVGTDITDLKEKEQRLNESEQKHRATIADLQLSRRAAEHQKQQLVDLTEKYALERNRAEAANRSKSEFLASMSHELRTPLNAVIGFSEVMRDGLFGPLGNEKYLEYARDIHASGRYLLEVINDILDMSKIEAGRMTLAVEAFDVGTIIDDSLRVVTPGAEERRIGLRRAGLGSLSIKADRRALKQILINLLSNAVKFTPEGGRVTVRLARRAEGLCSIAIADTGIGIPKTRLGRLGRPFEQVENQFSKSRGGSGLGLAISRSLLEMHGGHLEIASRESKGTTVTCVLPLRPVLAPDGGGPEDGAAAA